MEMKRWGIRYRKMLRRTYGPVVEKEIWIISFNQEMRELYKYLDKVAYIRRKYWNGQDM